MFSRLKKYFTTGARKKIPRTNISARSALPANIVVPPPARGARNVLPANIWSKIASMSPSVRATLARTIPGVVKRNTRVINRSKIMSYAVPNAGKIKLTGGVNRMNPAALKNTQWKYFLPYTKNHTIFYNTKNGPGFMINKKSGKRVPVPKRAVMAGNNTLNVVANRYRNRLSVRKATNTWNAYVKRVGKGTRYAKGESARTNKLDTINNKVANYKRGNKSALNSVTLADLVWWSYMRKNGRHYKKAGKWYNSYTHEPVSKNNIV